MAVQQGDNALEFSAPLDVNDELVKLYFEDLTQSQVKCEKQSYIVRVSCKNEKAFQKISSSTHEVDAECRLTPFWSDSAPLLLTFPGLGEITENRSFICLSLHVDSRWHITEYCLEDLKTFVNEPRYILHRTSVPGELLLEWHGLASERAHEMVVRRIYEYADNFSTSIVEVSEQIADERLRVLLDEPPRVEISCIKISQRCKDHLYMITGKKTEMASLLYFLPGVMPVPQLFVAPATAIAGLEQTSTTGDLFECDEAAARTEMSQWMEPQREVTSFAMTNVKSGDVAQWRNGKSFSSDQLQSALDHDSPPTETGADQKKTHHLAQGHSHAKCETCLRNCPDSTFCNESALPLGLNSDPQQQKQNFRRMQGNEQSDQRGFELSEKACNLSDAQVDPQQQEQDFRRMQGNEQCAQRGLELTEEACNLSEAQIEELWLAEQKSIGTLPGRVNLCSASTMEEQLERKSDDREVEMWLENEKHMGTKPGKVILRKEAVRSAVDDDSVPRREQRRKLENEQQTVEQKSERDFRKRAMQSELTGCSSAKSNVTSPECYHDDCQAPNASFSVYGSVPSITETAV